MGLSGFDDEPELEPEPFDITKTSKMTQDLVALYTDYAESASSVKESVDAKYDADKARMRPILIPMRLIIEMMKQILMPIKRK